MCWLNYSFTLWLILCEQRNSYITAYDSMHVVDIIIRTSDWLLSFNRIFWHISKKKSRIFLFWSFLTSEIIKQRPSGHPAHLRKYILYKLWLNRESTATFARSPTNHEPNLANRHEKVRTNRGYSRQWQTGYSIRSRYKRLYHVYRIDRRSSPSALFPSLRDQVVSVDVEVKKKLVKKNLQSAECEEKKVRVEDKKKKT